MWSSGPTGDNPFVVLAPALSIPQGPSRSDFDGHNELERVSSSALVQFAFEAYGNNAFDFCELARAALESEAGRMMFKALGGGLVATMQTVDLSGLAGSEEHRARFTMTLSTVLIVETALLAIELADIYVHSTHGADELEIDHIPVTPPAGYQP